MCKIIDRLRTGKTPAERSGVIWDTQGSGKSLTMVFVIRKLRMCDDLKDFKICLINDRRDLEDQLRKTAALTGEKVTTIASTRELKTQLATATPNLNMVMVHKFWEHHKRGLPDYLESVLERVPTFESFGLVNPSERILLMIDEAHRTQSGDLGDNLSEAFPNATRLAFTGTPLIVVKDWQKTVERFGDYIDKYRFQDAVDDGTTVQILYEGKTADAAIDRKYEFDMKVEEHAAEYVTTQLRKAKNIDTLQRVAARENRLFDDLVRERTAEEILALKKKWGTSGDLLEAEQRIAAIAADLVDHYIDNILPNGFKAQVVCGSKMAGVRYKIAIDQAIAERLLREQAMPVWIGAPQALPEDEREQYRDEELCRKIAFLKSAVVISSNGTNESAAISEARRHARAVDAVENFKRAFDFDNPEKTDIGIAFLIVRDKLLTGLDAPIEQVMYIDKKVQAHTLLQTIPRVNGVAKGKTRGYIVDYIGLARHLQGALSIYAADDQHDLQGMLQDISVEAPVLEGRYRRLLHLLRENGVAEIKRFGYILTKVKQRYKDDSLNLSGAGEKVKQLIDEHLISLGINPKIPPVELLSPNFRAEVEKNQASKAKASEMEHAIRKYTHVHFDEDPAFYTKLSDKLEALIRWYKDDWEALYHSLFDLRQEVAAGRGNAMGGVSAKAAPFYDLIGQLAFGSDGVPDAYTEAVKRLAAEVMALLQRTITIVTFWHNGPEVSKLKGAFSDLILFTRIDALIACSDELVTEITALAKMRHRDIVL